MGLTEIEAAWFGIAGVLLIIGCLLSVRTPIAEGASARGQDLFVLLLGLAGLVLFGLALLDVFVDHN
jgi:hypothetical protein